MTATAFLAGVSSGAAVTALLVGAAAATVLLAGIAAIGLVIVGYIAGYDARTHELNTSEFEWADESLAEIRNLPEAITR